MCKPTIEERPQENGSIIKGHSFKLFNANSAKTITLKIVGFSKFFSLRKYAVAQVFFDIRRNRYVSNRPSHQLKSSKIEV